MRKAYVALATAILAAPGCKQEDILHYDKNRASTEFASRASDHTFFRIGGDVASEDVVSITFNVVGETAPHERTAAFEVIKDSTTAAKFEILDSKVPADSWTGTLRVKVQNTMGAAPIAAKDMPRIYLRAVAGGDFEAGPLNMRDHSLYLSNTLVKPTEWSSWLARYGGLGEYSTAFYSFIIEVTGVTHFPIRAGVAGYNDGKIWTPGQTSAFLANITDKLRERNQRVGSPLLHDDGNGAGKEVIVGKAYL